MDTNEKVNLSSNQRQENIAQTIFDLAFQYNGKEYNGWAKPSKQKDDDEIPSSYHIVLNGVFFGNLSYNNKQWENDSQRDHSLVQKVGEQIAKGV